VETLDSPGRYRCSASGWIDPLTSRMTDEALVPSSRIESLDWRRYHIKEAAKKVKRDIDALRKRVSDEADAALGEWLKQFEQIVESEDQRIWDEMGREAEALKKRKAAQEST
jgi:hypothetical protein